MESELGLHFFAKYVKNDNIHQKTSETHDEFIQIHVIRTGKSAGQEGVYNSLYLANQIYQKRAQIRPVTRQDTLLVSALPIT